MGVRKSIIDPCRERGCATVGLVFVSVFAVAFLLAISVGAWLSFDNVGLQGAGASPKAPTYRNKKRGKLPVRC